MSGKEGRKGNLVEFFQGVVFCDCFLAVNSEGEGVVKCSRRFVYNKILMWMRWDEWVIMDQCFSVAADILNSEG